MEVFLFFLLFQTRFYLLYFKGRRTLTLNKNLGKKFVSLKKKFQPIIESENEKEIEINKPVTFDLVCFSITLLFHLLK